MRISSALLTAMLLAGCGSPESTRDQPSATNPALAAAEARQQARIADEGRIACAQAGGDFARSCTVERTQAPRGLILTVRDPDGGFHRLRVTDDGRGVVAADGAERATVTLAGNTAIEVAIGSMRYRLPATTKAATAPR
jgi:hypothetical protein